MKYIWLVLNWMFGSFFLLIGFVFVFINPLIAIPFVAISMLLLPPIRNFVHSKTKKKIPLILRAISIIVLFILFIIITVTSELHKDKKEEEKKQLIEKQNQLKIKQQNIEYFNKNHSNILFNIKEAIKLRNYQKAISLSIKYLPTNNSELEKLYQTAQNALLELEKEEKTTKILAKLKTIPEKEYKKNRYLYQKLSLLYPNNEKYKIKIKYFNKKITDKWKKEQQIERRKKQIKQQFDLWDGSHKKLTKWIKRRMNDPDSYKHAETLYSDKGEYLIIKTTYRGKNAFGGVVVNWVKAKADNEGNIIEIIETYP